MLEDAKTPMLVFVVIAWLLSAALVFAVVRWKLKPDMRRTMRRVAWLYSAAAIFVFLSFTPWARGPARAMSRKRRVRTVRIRCAEVRLCERGEP